MVFSHILNAIKAWGVGHAIDSLDNLEEPLGAKIDAQLDIVRKLEGKQLAKYLVDEAQDWLRLYFHLPAKSEDQSKNP